MRIDHMALYTNNLERMKEFYVKYFDAKVNKLYHNKSTGLKTYFLSFDDDTRLEIMTRPGINDEKIETIQLGYVHLAFSVGCRDGVNRFTDILRREGFIVINNPRITGDGYYESVVLDPDGNQIEIVE
ncbi:UNVERIFIED_CONTAM: lactoylglutathione lyase [Acetivibrio alkalicellulosi]